MNIGFLSKGQVLIPEDTESYLALRKLGVPSTLLHRDFLPALEILTKPKDITISVKPLRPFINAKIDSLAVAWRAKEGRRCKLKEGRLSFTAPLTTANKRTVDKVNLLLQNFFARWGCYYSPTYSEKDDKLKFSVDYRLYHRTPVIQVIADEVLNEYELVLGFTKIKLVFNPKQKFVLLHILTSAGNTWNLVHSGSFSITQIEDIKPMVLMAGRLAEFVGEAR